MTESQNMVDDDPNRAPLCEKDVREAIAVAAVPTLLMVIYQFTGDDRWIQERYRPTRGKGLGLHDSGGLSDEIQREVREAALPVVQRILNGEPPVIADLDETTTIKLAAFFLGEEVPDRYGRLLVTEIGNRAHRKKAIEPVRGVNVPDGFTAVVIGLGIAGVAGIHLLQELGIDFEVFERSPKPGGVWFDNTYPGAGVDTPSHLYSFSYAYRDWRRYFELRDEIRDYVEDVVEKLDATDRVRYETEVTSCVYDDETALWTVTVRDADGDERTVVSNMVISAVGALNKPKLPRIPGMERFRGEQFHSAQWDRSMDVEGKRVVIVGAGASSQQISPEIAPKVDNLTIFQRSPQWIAPFDLFRQEIPAGQRLLLRSVPLFYAWTWVRYFWQFGDKVIEALRVDPEWEHQDRSVNSWNDAQRRFFIRYIESQLEGRPDLIEKSTPDYPPFGKRILLDNGWYKTIQRDNVELRTEGIAEVDETGVIGSSGDHIDADVIVWATGFDAAYFLDSLEVYGSEETHLRELWDTDDPRAYLGVSIPRFPNFFMLGGPHSFPGSGSFMYFMEVQERYLRDLLSTMFNEGTTSIDASQEATDRYNDLVDEVHSRTVWTHPGFGTFYRNSKGRVIFVMPFLNIEYFEFTERTDIENYTRRKVPYVAAKEGTSASGSR